MSINKLIDKLVKSLQIPININFIDATELYSKVNMSNSFMIVLKISIVIAFMILMFIYKAHWIVEYLNWIILILFMRSKDAMMI